MTNIWWYIHDFHGLMSHQNMSSMFFPFSRSFFFLHTCTHTHTHNFYKVCLADITVFYNTNIWYLCCGAFLHVFSYLLLRKSMLPMFFLTIKTFLWHPVSVPPQWGSKENSKLVANLFKCLQVHIYYEDV